MRRLLILVSVCCLALAACGSGATATPVPYTHAEIGAIFLMAASRGDVETARQYYCPEMQQNYRGDTFVTAFSNRGVVDILCLPGPYPESAWCTFTRTKGLTGGLVNEEVEIILNMAGGQFCGTY